MSRASTRAVNNLCEVDKTNQDNMRLIAKKNISKGKRIIEEKVLLECDCGPSTLYNPSTFFNENAALNVVDELRRSYDGLSKRDQKEFDSLHHGPDGLASAVKLNCFNFNEERHGQNRKILRVFKDISRINHSCHPNAVVDWNPALGDGRGRMILHAICEIAQGEEINIDYMPDVEGSLRNRNVRRKSLKGSYGFDCLCEACGPSKSPLDANDKARVAASKLYKTQCFAVKDCETPEQGSQRRIDSTKEYIRLLYQVHRPEFKVAEAYDHLAELQLAAYRDAKHFHPQVDGHCEKCAEDQSNRHHAQAAIAAYDDSYGLYVRCLGTDHPRVFAVEAEKRSLLLLVDEAPSPRAHRNAHASRKLR